MADTVDLAILERRDELDVVVDGEVEALRAVDVEVAVKGGETERRTVWWSSLGPA